MPTQSEVRGRTIAVVSGKGGSGKTMIAVSMAQGLATAGHSVLLIDTDFATGGLTYYLTFRAFQNPNVGLVDLLQGRVTPAELLQEAGWGLPEDFDSRWSGSMRLIPIGDQRRIDEDAIDGLSEKIESLLYEARQSSHFIIVDCRGGIDKQSIEVCRQCDDILVVVETDTTSIQASQHLIDVLSRYELRRRLLGYILNKVMDDPTVLAKTASSLLRTTYLGAIPFDIDATRAYIQGKMPKPSTLFCRHVFFTLRYLSIEAVRAFGQIRTLSPDEFGTVSLRPPEARVGGLFIGIASIYVSLIAGYYAYTESREKDVLSMSFTQAVLIIIAVNALVIVALSDTTKQAIGRFFNALRGILRIWAVRTTRPRGVRR